MANAWKLPGFGRATADINVSRATGRPSPTATSPTQHPSDVPDPMHVKPGNSAANFLVKEALPRVSDAGCGIASSGEMRRQRFAQWPDMLDLDAAAAANHLDARLDTAPGPDHKLLG